MHIITIPCSFDNYSYLLVCEKTGVAAVVDPSEFYPVMSQVEEQKVNLTTILCTHHHNDHIADIDLLLETYPDLAIYCHNLDKDNIVKANRYVDGGERINLGNLDGTVLHTPGHTSGSICFHFRDAVFTGDTLFGAGCGRLFEGTAAQMYGSLSNKIASLADDTRLFFGHEYTQKNLEFSVTVEPQNDLAVERMKVLQQTNEISAPTTVKLEKETNPFLRCDSENIKNNLRERGVEAEGALEVFTVLRQMRNSF